MSFGSGAKRNSKPGIEKLQQLVFLDSIEPSDSVATTRKPRPKIMNALAKCKSLKLFLQAGGGTKENVSGEIMRPRLVDATFAKNAGQEITSKSGKQKSVSPFIDLYQIERRNNAPKNDQKGSSPKGNQQSS